MKEVYRMTISNDEILGTLEAMSCLSAAQMPKGARELQKKLQLQAAKINIGAANPAYVTTGIKEKQRINLENLGATEDEFQGTNTGIVTGAMLTANAPTSDMQAAKPSADLDKAMEAELERLNAEMLAEVANNGAGSDNVILTERRKVPRTSIALDVTDL